MKSCSVRYRTDPGYTGSTTPWKSAATFARPTGLFSLWRQLEYTRREMEHVIYYHIVLFYVWRLLKANKDLEPLFPGKSWGADRLRQTACEHSFTTKVTSREIHELQPASIPDVPHKEIGDRIPSDSGN